MFLDSHVINQNQINKVQRSYTFNIGDIISISLKIKEGKKERIQVFNGVCIAKKGKGIGRTFTVRRTDFKGRVERIFPFFSPSIEGIITKQQSKIKRAKLYYLRALFGKKSKLKKLVVNNIK